MSEAIHHSSTEKYVLEMTREFSASRERVFGAFSRFESMAAWFGPQGCDVTGGSLDFVVGGSYRLELTTDEDGDVAVGGIYKEIAPPERIVFSWKWDSGDDVMEIAFVFLELAPERTELRLRQVMVPNKDIAERHGWGWSSTFERLEALFSDQN